MISRGPLLCRYGYFSVPQDIPKKSEQNMRGAVILRILHLKCFQKRNTTEIGTTDPAAQCNNGGLYVQIAVIPLCSTYCGTLVILS